MTLETADNLAVPPEFAGLGSRSYAFTIDWHIRAILAVAWLAAYWFFTGFSFASLRDGADGSLYTVLMPPLTIYLLYHPLLEIALRGYTPGKRMTGIRIVDVQGRIPTAGALLVRNVCRLLDSLPALYALGIGMVLATRDQVRLGDLATNTRLVYDRTARMGDQRANHDSELVLELLERWPDLDRQVRHELGLTLLRRWGHEPAAGLNDRDLRGHLARRLSESMVDTR